MIDSGHITVALCAYNAEKTIRRAIESLVRQTYPYFDVYIVDDGSTDSTAEIAELFVRHHSNIHLIKTSRNVGTYVAKNIVLKHFASSEFFAHQDADDYSWPERFEQQIAFLKNNQQIAACGTAIDEFFETLEVYPRLPSLYPTEWQEHDQASHRINQYEEYMPRASCFTDYSIEDFPKLKIAMNGSLLFRTNVVKELGGFEGETKIGADTEMLWRLILFNDFANLPEVLYSRYYHADSLSMNSTLGHHSTARIAYIEAIKNRLLGWKKLYEAGKLEELRHNTKYDFYDDGVSFTAQHHVATHLMRRDQK